MSVLGNVWAEVEREENKRLTLENADLKRSSETQISSLQAENDHLRGEYANLQKNHGIILKNFEATLSRAKQFRQEIADRRQQRNLEALDKEARYHFLELRDLVRDASEDYKMETATYLDEDQKEFFGMWETRDHRERVLRVRSAIAKCLKQHIFDVPFFGLDKKREEFMQAFEEEARGKVSELALIGWRSRTAAIAQSLQCWSDQADEITDKILFFTDPAYARPLDLASNSIKGKLWYDLRAVVEKAVGLKMLFRASRVELVWESIPVGTVVELDEKGGVLGGEMEIEGREGGGTENAVLFNVFGVLVRRVEMELPIEGDREVLVKAQVVVTA